MAKNSDSNSKKKPSPNNGIVEPAPRAPITTLPTNAKAASPAKPTNSPALPSVENSPEAKPSSPILKEKNLWELIGEAKDNSDLEKVLIDQATKILKGSPIAEKYHVLMLYAENTSISRHTTDRLYSTLRSVAKLKDKPLLLIIILSNGGSVESAYLISKACKEYAKETFAVAIPRHAKSAATLIALGADEVHMGIMSELGPIDPQINGVPALALKHALENVSELCEKYPKATTMFSEYLAKTLKITELGYYERICRSAAQYAELLLRRRFPAKGRAESLAAKLVYEYKDHGFVIDHEEAVRFFGVDFIKYDTDEAQLAEKIHELIENFSLSIQFIKDKRVSWILGRFDEPSILLRNSSDSKPNA